MKTETHFLDIKGNSINLILNNNPYLVNSFSLRENGRYLFKTTFGNKDRLNVFLVNEFYRYIPLENLGREKIDSLSIQHPDSTQFHMYGFFLADTLDVFKVLENFRTKWLFVENEIRDSAYLNILYMEKQLGIEKSVLESILKESEYKLLRHMFNLEGGDAQFSVQSQVLSDSTGTQLSVVDFEKFNSVDIEELYSSPEKNIQVGLKFSFYFE